MKQKGFALIIIILLIALIAVAGLYIYKPKAMENLVSDLLNKNKSISTLEVSLPTTTSNESPTNAPTIKVSPRIIPSPTFTPVPTIKPTVTIEPYPTPAGNWQEGVPDKKDRPYMGG